MDHKATEYCIEHVARGCYQVIRTDTTGKIPRYEYMTNFKNKKAAKNFIEEYKKGKVSINPVTRVPIPDFQ